MNQQQPDDRRLLRMAIASAVGAIRRGGSAGTPLPLGMLNTSSDQVARVWVTELATANAEMLRALSAQLTADSSDDDLMLTVGYADSDAAEVDIDQLEPAERTATRVMLAIANRSPGDADIHLDIAIDLGAETELRGVLVHTVLWTLELLDQCDRSGRPVPSWLYPVTAGH